ncbi:hypothetical protein EVAR_29303_1 [Eumeta japonica]|uniref:Uncharacterized protein n=1 Tax=Eumeta variegata TaxID=151549 RepID=A0A4C1VWB1_EUMVA|nr:hypothetical protein EVAR_29303_1 [Eumeta japonica]
MAWHEPVGSYNDSVICIDPSLGVIQGEGDRSATRTRGTNLSDCIAINQLCHYSGRSRQTIRESPPLMNTRSPGGITSALPASWEDVGYLSIGFGLMEGGEGGSVGDYRRPWTLATTEESQVRGRFLVNVIDVGVLSETDKARLRIEVRLSQSGAEAEETEFKYSIK